MRYRLARAVLMVIMLAAVGALIWRLEVGF